MKRAALLLALSFLLTRSSPGLAGESAPQDASALEFFEKEVRPLLADKCQSCHGDEKRRGGLRLTSRDLVLKGGGRGAAIVPGKPEESLLLRAVEQQGDLKMPPKGKLTEAERNRLRRWIALGVPWPVTAPAVVQAAGGGFQATAEQRRWWAFQPVRPVTPPAAEDVGMVDSAIDGFLREGLNRHGLHPSFSADKRTLLRRATFDLTGLPPTPEQVQAFLQNESPEAFARVVDRLLASPAYGERWARHWLDVVRYADYHDGDPKARTASCDPLNAWRYRDWVVASFNRDLPFDQFIVHQIAGDLLPSPDGQEYYADGLVATTFLSNGSWDRGDADKEKMVSDMVDDHIDTIGKAFMGLTLGCARCHNHKFDPISQADYYGLAGVFYSTHILKDIGTKGGEYTLNRVPLAPKSYVAKREEQVRRLNELAAKITELDKKSPRPPELEAARTRLVQERDRLQRELLPEPPVAEAAQEGGQEKGLFPKIQDVPIHIRGSYTRLGAVVPRRLPLFFAGDRQAPIRKGSGRLEVARWVASRDNPLTARVIVNRVWQAHFGAGLVRTPNNFGMLSEPPSHPALLDWLAARFVEDGWSLKKLHRRIMLTAAYQQTSTVSRAVLAQDSDNRWLGRFLARRLEAEAIRDAMLFVAGRLDPAPGGPAAADLNTARRSLYVQTARWDRGSFAILFDAANPDASVERRDVSTVAPQALFLLNHDFVRTQADRLAARLAREAPADETGRLQYAYQLLFARSASPEEVAIGRDFLARAGQPGAESAWRDLAHVLLCSNEFIYVD
jgi:hypothetical protein